jgi:hypothetical protein
MRAPSGKIDSGPQRDALGHAVEPACQAFALAERASMPHKDEKRCLKCVVRIVHVAQHVPANAQDHRPVPIEQGRKRSLGNFTGAYQEPVQKLAIGQSAGCADMV